MTITQVTTPQAAAAAATALHAFAVGNSVKVARSALSTGGQWTLVALNTAVRHAYPATTHGPRLAPANLRGAADVVSALHSFLVNEYTRAVDERDPALPLIDVAGDVAFAACQVLADDRHQAARDA